jgi:glucose-1-phosphate cytidylyltransferase
MTVVQPELQFGVAELNGDGHVSGFTEKPRFEGWINGGFFCFEPAALEYIGPDSVLERDPLERLAADRSYTPSAISGSGTAWTPTRTPSC